MNTGLKMNLIRVLGVWAPEPQEGAMSLILVEVAPELEEGAVGSILSKVAPKEGSMRSSSTRGGMCLCFHISFWARWMNSELWRKKKRRRKWLHDKCKCVACNIKRRKWLCEKCKCVACNIHAYAFAFTMHANAKTPCNTFAFLT